jgi:hypothetical protein
VTKDYTLSKNSLFQFEGVVKVEKQSPEKAQAIQRLHIYQMKIVFKIFLFIQEGSMPVPADAG